MISMMLNLGLRTTQTDSSDGGAGGGEVEGDRPGAVSASESEGLTAKTERKLPLLAGTLCLGFFQAEGVPGVELREVP